VGKTFPSSAFFFGLITTLVILKGALRGYIYIEGEIGININGARTSGRRDVQGE
jgi:hypothetical protein